MNQQFGKLSLFYAYFFFIFKFSTLDAQKYPVRVRIIEEREIEDEYLVEIKSDNDTRQLRLTPLESVWSETAQALIITQNEDGELVYERRNIFEFLPKVYHDVDAGSVLSLKEGKLYGILDPDFMIRYEDEQHFLIKTEREDGNENDYVFPEIIPSMFEEMESESESPEVMQLTDEVTFRQGKSYTPEVAAIVDSRLANLIGNDLDIYEYLTIFWNGVKKRFDTISSSVINIRLVGSVIIRNSSGEPFITMNAIQDDQFRGSEALYDLGVWVRSVISVLPDHDIMYLQTAREIVNSSGSTSLNGISYITGACKLYKYSNRSVAVGMGEDKKAFFNGVHTAAHELAHSLGSYHDGDAEHGTGSCNWNDGYIMSYVGGTPNRLFFSNCTITLMTSYMKTSTAACLTTNLNETKPPGAYNSSSLPGDLITMTEQCRQITGRSQATVYTNVSPEDILCYNLKCRYFENGTYWIHTTKEVAAEGSECPSGKYCFDGKCI